MYGVQQQEDHDAREFYRCSVDAKKSAARIKYGWGNLRASVFEKSINSYTLLMQNRHAKKLRVGKTYRMKFDSTHVVVAVKRIAEIDNGFAHVGMCQVDDLTPPERIKSSWMPRIGSGKAGESNAHLFFAGFVLMLFCAMAMPGLGDRLGTSSKIQKAFHWMIDTADSEVSGMTR
ncbi:MAG: hypothetical protein HKN47_03120 [Pirellulaceae bacterium]|nr:hypothetical protein [Pirellulaceae bacterium]